VDITTRDDVWDLLEQQLKQDVRLEWNPSGPIVLAIDSEKGGVGKSGLAAGLIAVMAANDYKVCGIDLDPRATLTEELGAETGEFSVNDLLYVDPRTEPDDLPELSGMAAQALRPAGEAWGGNVQVLAAERALANRENDSINVEHRLRVALEGVADRFDLVVIDLPPRAGGKLVGAGLLAATHVIFPGTLDRDGFVGVKDAKRTCKVMQQTNTRKLIEVGVLRNIVDRRTELGKLFDGHFAEEFGDHLLPVAVPRRVIRQEARTACVPITASTSQGARDVINGYTVALNHIGRAV
jgi:chromosome partitioning protein